MKILILWGNLPFDSNKREAEKVLFYYLIEKNLNNEQFSIYFEKATVQSLDVRLTPQGLIDDHGNITISVDADGNNTDTNFWKNYDAIFILAELDWNGNDLSRFYGITVAQKIRLQDITLPIFICSFMDETVLINKEQFKILNFRGHYFVRLPIGLLEDIEINSLEGMELIDCKTHFCSLEAAIREIYHRKQHALSEKNLKKAKIIVKELLVEIINLKDFPDHLKPVVNKLTIEVDQIKTKTELNIYCKADDSRILAYLEGHDKPGKAKSTPDIINGNWEILILEDVREDIELLIQSLQKSGMNKENIHVATTFDEAVKYISEDVFNFITIVICDYRLEKDKRIKGKQGYSFVDWLSKQDRFNEIFVYSGLARKFLKDTFKQFNIRVNINSKYDIISDRVTEFVEEIIDKGNEQYISLLNQPKSGIWEYSLKAFYAHYRNDPNYKELERNISYQAKSYINHIDYFFNLPLKDDKDITWFNQILKEGNIITPFKDIRKIQLRKTLQTDTPPLPKKYNEYDEYYATFKYILVIRRIVLWLKYHRNINLLTIANLIFNGSFYNISDNKKQTKDAKDKTLITYSCVADDDIEKGRILVEEKNWLNLIIGGFSDTQKIYDTEKIVHFERSLWELHKLYKDNIEGINMNKEILCVIKSCLIILKIEEKKNCDKPFTKLKEILENINNNAFNQFIIKYLKKSNQVIFKNEYFGGFIFKIEKGFNNETEKEIIVKQFIEVLDKYKNEIDYVDAITKYCTDEINIFDNLMPSFEIDFNLNAQHPYEIFKLVKAFKSYPTLAENIVLTNIEKLISKTIDLKYYEII